MKVIYALALCAALAAGWAGGWRGHNWDSARPISGGQVALRPVETPAGRTTEVAGNTEPTAAMALAGLEQSPDLQMVCAASGSDRWLKLGLFLRVADSAALEDLLILQSETGGLSEDELECVWQKWVEVDIAAAVAWNSGDSAVWKAWGRVDPKAALTAAGENAPRLAAVIRSIGLKDPDWAERLLARYPQVDAAFALAGAVDQLSGVDPAAAANLAMAKGIPWEKQVAAWTMREPEAALAWAGQVHGVGVAKAGPGRSHPGVDAGRSGGGVAAGPQAATGTGGEKSGGRSHHRPGPD